ncbi:MAG TPA: hypothetical protein VGO55_16520 [Allosphingosinicella sp.]|nr:hypothetical protein [Allosphingosinicella sp.]
MSAGGVNRENPAMRLAQIQTQTYYIVHDRALAEGRTQEDPEHPDAWEAACDGLDPRGDNVPADNPAQRDARLCAGQRAGRGRPRRTGACAARLQPHALERAAAADEAACLRELRGLGDHSLGWVSECRGTPESANCISVLTDAFFINFSLNAGQRPIAIRIEGFED